MVTKGSYFVLLIIVVVLTLTLAALAGYLFLFTGSAPADKETFQDNILQRPSDKQLAYVNLFSENNFFNLKSEDRPAVIQLSAQLGFKKSSKGIKNVEEKINFNLAKIKEITGTYFQGLTYEEITQGGAKQKANEELTRLINDFLLSNERYKEDIIYEVVFDKWFFQQ